MNLSPIVSNANSLWLYFAVTVPVLLVSLVVMNFDFEIARRMFASKEG